jgi:5'-nucleotidase
LERYAEQRIPNGSWFTIARIDAPPHPDLERRRLCSARPRRRPDRARAARRRDRLRPRAHVFYSGTVAAAREGALRGVPSIALSADKAAEPAAAAALGARLALALHAALRGGEPRIAPLLNVNIPPGNAWRVRATRIGARLYAEEVVFREDPRGKEYLWIGGAGVRHDQIPGSDTEAFDEGWVSITPLTLDLFAAQHERLAADIAVAAVAPLG